MGKFGETSLTIEEIGWMNVAMPRYGAFNAEQSLDLDATEALMDDERDIIDGRCELAKEMLGDHAKGFIDNVHVLKYIAGAADLPQIDDDWPDPGVAVAA